MKPSKLLLCFALRCATIKQFRKLPFICGLVRDDILPGSRWNAPLAHATISTITLPLARYCDADAKRNLLAIGARAQAIVRHKLKFKVVDGSTVGASYV